MIQCGITDQVLSVTIKNSKYYRTTGWANCYEEGPPTGDVCIFIAKGFDGTDKWDITELGQILTHELHHVLGLDHDQMLSWPTLPVDWALKYEIRHQKGKKKEKRWNLERQLKLLTLELDLLEPHE